MYKAFLTIEVSWDSINAHFTVSRTNFEPKVCASPEKAVECIESGDTIFIHTAAAAPLPLVNALVNIKDEVRNVQVIHLHIDSDGLNLSFFLSNSEIPCSSLSRSTIR